MTKLLIALLFSFTAHASFFIPDHSITPQKINLQTCCVATAGIGGLAVSASSGSFSTTSTTYVNVTNLSVTITTSGRPVSVGLVDDGTLSGGGGGVTITNSSPSSAGSGSILRNGTTFVAFPLFLTAYPLTTSPSTVLALPGSAISTLDFVTAGTYTYIFQAKAGTSPTTGTNVNVYYVKLFAYEK